MFFRFLNKSRFSTVSLTFIRHAVKKLFCLQELAVTIFISYIQAAMTKKILHIVLRSGLYLSLPAIVAWMAGAAFVFPSLGPTAYVLAFDDEVSHSSSVVIGGHTCGVAGGLMSYYLIVSPYILYELGEPFSAAGIALSAGCIVALALTALFMLFFKVSHPPACATTLIVSLGILPEWEESLIIIAAVSLMYGCYRLYHKMISDNSP